MPKKYVGPANPGDRVMEKAEGFYIVCNGKTIGVWRSRKEAEGGLRVEQKRHAKRLADLIAGKAP